MSRSTLNIETALQKFREFVAQNLTSEPITICSVQPRLYGWVVHWNSAAYIQTGLNSKALLANYPHLLTKWGEIHPIFGRDVNEFLRNWEVEHNLAYLYPDGVVDADAIDQIRIEYLKEFEPDDLL